MDALALEARAEARTAKEAVKMYDAAVRYFDDPGLDDLILDLTQAISDEGPAVECLADHRDLVESILLRELKRRTLCR